MDLSMWALTLMERSKGQGCTSGMMDHSMLGIGMKTKYLELYGFG